MKYLIIGNGITGISAAEAIREHDQEGEIIMVGDESFPPYSRPMISQVLEGSQPHEKLPIRNKEFYETHNIKTVLGQRAKKLNIDDQTVILADGSSLAFDRLLIASGADPRPIKAHGLNLENIFFMRTQAHVKQQIKAISGASNALVLGGGLVGFKAAYGLLRRGLKVTMLITSGYPLAMQVDEVAGNIILNKLRIRGLEVQVGTSVIRFSGNGKVATAHTDNGSEIPCDMVIVGKGVLPALDFVPKDRIKVDLGIVVDETLQTSQSHIYAAGDVAETTDIARQRPWVNAIWPEAASQGRIAGHNMASTDHKMKYAGSLSRNVMRIFDLDVLSLGIGNPETGNDFNIYRNDFRQGFYRSLVFKKDILVGAVLVNRIEQGGVIRALIENQVPIVVSPDTLMSESFNFSKIIF